MLFTQDLTTMVFLTLAFLLGVAFHEANHAVVATALGDDTPRRHGRLTLNPLRHIDLIGTITFVLAGVGWGWTPVSPWKLRPDPRIGGALVAVAGPLANLLLAFLLSIPLRAGIDVSPTLRHFLLVATTLNLLLFTLNLLPIPPLDGFTVLLGLLPSSMAASLQQLERVGPGLIFLLLFLSGILGLNVLGIFFGPVARAFGLPGLR